MTACENNSYFSVPCIRSFRFLLKTRGYKITLIERTGRQSCVAFRQNQHRLTFTEECGWLFYIHYELMKNPRSPDTVTMVDATPIIARFSRRKNLVNHRFESPKEELECWSALLEKNWEGIFECFDKETSRQHRALKRLENKIAKFLSQSPDYAAITFELHCSTKMCSFKGDVQKTLAYDELDKFAKFEGWWVLFDVTVQGESVV